MEIFPETFVADTPGFSHLVLPETILPQDIASGFP
jgi:putative ribosome biogenesis GTPase RsgA